MLSESFLRSDRITREIASFAKIKGMAEHQLEYITYILLVALAFRDSSQIYNYLPSRHASELASLVADIVNAESPDKVVNKLVELNQLLANAMSVGQRGIPEGPGDLALAISHISAVLMHETRDLDSEGRHQVIDSLFYKLFVRYMPSHRKHHQIAAQIALPLANFYGSASESELGSGEISIAAGKSRNTTYGQHRLFTNSAVEPSETFRFIRDLRLATYGVIRNSVEGPENLCILDTTLEPNRSVYGEKAVVLYNRELLTSIAKIRYQQNSPLFVVASAKHRRPLKSSRIERKELVDFHGLRAVIDFTSIGPKGPTTLSLWFFGTPFPNIQDDIIHVDTRHLCANAMKTEAVSCAAVIGELLRVWAEGGSLSRARLEDTGAPRRVVTFIEEAFNSERMSVPGFMHVVSKGEMARRDYSLRAQDYVGQREVDSWRPEVEIAPLLERLSKHKGGVALYLIGDNGAGKSLAMRDMAMALALQGQSSIGVAFGSTDRFERFPRLGPLKSKFFYAGARNFQSGPNTRRSLTELGDLVRQIYREPQRFACFEAALDTLGFQPRQFLVPVEMNSTSDHWERLIAEVYPLSASFSTEAERVDHDRWEALPAGSYKLAVIRRDSPEILVFDSLSSGEQQVLTMVIKIVANVQPDTTVLLDEPEISLHVAWQRQLPEILGNFSRSLQCSFVVATHSPVVIASANAVHDYCFVMKNRSLRELQHDQRRSVEASLFEGFNTYTPYTHHIQERCAELVSRVIGGIDEDGIAPKGEIKPLIELKVLKNKLETTRPQETANDIALIDKAIIAIQGILDYE